MHVGLCSIIPSFKKQKNRENLQTIVATINKITLVDVESTNIKSWFTLSIIYNALKVNEAVNGAKEIYHKNVVCLRNMTSSLEELH